MTPNRILFEIGVASSRSATARAQDTASPAQLKPGADSLGDAATIAEMQELFRKSGEPDGNRTFREVVLMTSLDSRR